MVELMWWFYFINILCTCESIWETRKLFIWKAEVSQMDATADKNLANYSSEYDSKYESSLHLT